MEGNYSRKFKAKLLEAIEIRANSLAKGEALTYEVYRQSVGYIEGLNVAYALCEELDREMDQ